MYKEIVQHIRSVYNEPKEFIPLHEPRFVGNEKKYLNDCIDSTFVSSVGEYVNRFEEMLCEITGAKYAIATVNGTNALQIALILSGVQEKDEVLTQSLSFIATSNAIAYVGATPHYIDVDKDTMGMSPDSLEKHLSNIAEVKNDACYNKETGNRISACVPMHTFGLPLRIDKIKEICDKYGIALVEDAAESLGSDYKGKHTGTFGDIGILSFNGNKIVTAGGGGAIITDNEELATRAKHLTTTAKIPHQWEYAHDEIGYNFRMPNLNAALVCAQLENLPSFIQSKRKLSDNYKKYFESSSIGYATEIKDAQSNYWLNAIILENLEARNAFLEESNESGVMTRPIWRLSNTLPMYKNCPKGDLSNSEWLEDRIVNITSSVIVNE